jgi:hypothetical protein
VKNPQYDAARAIISFESVAIDLPSSGFGIQTLIISHSVDAFHKVYDMSAVGQTGHYCSGLQILPIRAISMPYTVLHQHCNVGTAQAVEVSPERGSQ